VINCAPHYLKKEVSRLIRPSYRLVARCLAILLSLSLILGPVASQAAPLSSDEAKHEAALTKDKAKVSTPRTVLESFKKDGPKAKASQAHAIGGVSVNGYPPLLIGPGDLLAVMVYGEVELPIEYQVDSNGVITYPYLGNVYVGGMTPAEASNKLARLLGKARKVTVLIKESNTYWVSVIGNVPKPGKYQIRGKPTLLSALSEAGGPMPRTRLGSTYLIHKGTKTKIDLKKFLKGEGETGPEPLLYPGDTLVVNKSSVPTLGELAIVASILASVAVVAVQMNNLDRNK
jgi:protein involved in polysaccharide export with SLBB domain